ncbi:hypothetical protein KEM48_010659 [Puccinia striiformis f. sp. tritici PST-130]|nr:hypothetical protein KEM48_010659 [Puccinia striiformis f. sp. tritici PST-130]
MLRFCRLIALVLLTTSWQVSGDKFDPKTGITYFGCNANVDAVCSNPGAGDKSTTLTWADRLHPKKRDYSCPNRYHPACCHKGVYSDLNNVNPAIVLIPPPKCHQGGQ